MRRMILISASTMALIVSAPANAADPDTAGARIIKSFADCRALPDPSERLACFDKAAGALEQAVQANDVRIVDRTEVRQARRSLFGFTLPRIGLFDREGDEKEKFTEINTTVASARQLTSGRVEIRLSDDADAIWQTTEAMTFPPKPGAKIRIRQATMGSYFITVDGRSVRGMRLR